MSKQKVSAKRLQEKNAKRAAHFQAFHHKGNARKLNDIHFAALAKNK